MPILRSSKKQLRQNKTHALRNQANKDRYRELRVNFERSITAKDSAKAQELFPGLQKMIDTLAKKNIIHKNTAARRKSLFAHRLAAVEQN